MTKTSETCDKLPTKKKKTLPDFAAWAQGMLQANQEEAASKQPSLAGQLLLVSTPIGNLGDITLRALWALAQVDAVFCEDTRVTGGLLSQYGIKKALISCHDHNEGDRVKDVLSRLKQGQSIAYVSDAGTPMISDPGFRLARACREAGYVVTALPGASAVLSALACAGLASDRFLFVGFLPSKKTARRTELEELAGRPETLVIYESPQRVGACLSDMAEIFGEGRPAALCRELTKLYEDIRHNSLGSLAASLSDEDPPKGEIVLVVQGAGPEVSGGAFDLEGSLLKALKSMSLRDAVEAVTMASGLKKKEVYQKALDLAEKS